MKARQRLLMIAGAAIAIAVIVGFEALGPGDGPEDPDARVGDRIAATAEAPASSSARDAIASDAPVSRLGPENADACAGVLESHLAWVEAMRAAHDERLHDAAALEDLLEDRIGLTASVGLESRAPPVSLPEAPPERSTNSSADPEDPAGAPWERLLPEPLAADSAPYRSTILGLIGCAEELGLLTPLCEQAARSFTEEPRPALRRLWLELLGHFPNCEPSKVRAILDAAWAALDGEGPPMDGGLEPLRTPLLMVGRCPDRVEDALGVLLAVITRLHEQGTQMVYLLPILASSFPFGESLERFTLEAMQAEDTAWAAVELLRMYGDRIGPERVRSTLEASGQLEAFLDGSLGPHARFATIDILAAEGGEWGAEQLRERILSAGLDPEHRAHMIASLAGSTAASVHWRFFEGLLADPADAVARAALQAIGERAGDDDEAFAWLRAHALGVDGAELSTALQALQASGRDLEALLRLDVLRHATGTARADALALYAAQEGADLSILEEAVRVDRDLSVRATAAYHHLLAGRDVDATARLMTEMIDDAEAGPYAAAALEVYYVHYKQDPDAWNAVKPWGYEMGATHVGWDAAGWLRQFRSAGFHQTVEMSRLMALVSESQGDGSARQLADQAWLDEFLLELAESLPDEDG